MGHRPGRLSARQSPSGHGRVERPLSRRLAEVLARRLPDCAERSRARLQGSADVFDHQRRRPWASINFITSHDGFTLCDWAAYNQKHNEANGEDNQDGTNDNESNNWGVEGPTEERPSVSAAIASSAARCWRRLLFSHGTPMLLGGDEFDRTQNGNNNAYCQDSELSWFDWSLAESARGRELRAYVARLVGLRREQRCLRSDYFQHGLIEVLPQVRDIEWFDESGDIMRPEDWGVLGGPTAMRASCRAGCPMGMPSCVCCSRTIRRNNTSSSCRSHCSAGHCESTAPIPRWPRAVSIPRRSRLPLTACCC